MITYLNKSLSLRTKVFPKPTSTFAEKFFSLIDDQSGEKHLTYLLVFYHASANNKLLTYCIFIHFHRAVTLFLR